MNTNQKDSHDTSAGYNDTRGSTRRLYQAWQERGRLLEDTRRHLDETDDTYRKRVTALIKLAHAAEESLLNESKVIIISVAFLLN